jgi:DNA adenine methylase
MCLWLALGPSEALVSDINGDLIQFYKMVRWRPGVVARTAQQWDMKPATYYRVRSLNPIDLSAMERAARFLYLNRFCFNGVYRTNARGKFNVPRGTHTGALPGEQELRNFGRLLRSVDLRCDDFQQVVSEARQDDFIYLDPPYAGRQVRNRGEYGAGSFGEDDISRLRCALIDADSRGAKVLLSYADIPAIREAFSGWQIESLDVKRNVSGFAHGRALAKEVIIRNYAG